jgi:hypothetical protein
MLKSRGSRSRSSSSSSSGDAGDLEVWELVLIIVLPLVAVGLVLAWRLYRRYRIGSSTEPEADEKEITQNSGGNTNLVSIFATSADERLDTDPQKEVEVTSSNIQPPME